MQNDGSSTGAAGPERLLRYATALYAGAVVAGIVTIAIAQSPSLVVPEPSPIVLAGAGVGGFVLGAALGRIVADRDRFLAARFGRTAGRRLLPLVPAVLFAALVPASWVVGIEETAVTVAIVSAAVAFASGHVFARLAQTSYVESIASEPPEAAWDWEPAGSPRLELLLLVLWLGMAALSAAGGNWRAAVVWTTLGVLWAGSRIAEGGLGLDVNGASSQLRVHEAGLVKRRPYTLAIVPWETIDHVRLRNDELVLDRGFVDVRIDRDEVGDLEGLQAAIDRHAADDRNRVRAAE